MSCSAPGQPARQQRVHRLVNRHQPALPGLAELVGHVTRGGVFHVEPIELRPLHQLDEPADARVHDLLRITRPLGELLHLGHDLPLLLERVGRPDRNLAAVESPREHRHVADPASDLHGLGGQRPSAGHAGVALLAQRARSEAREQACPQRAVVGREGLDGLLQQRQQVRVAPALRPHPAATVSEGGATQLLGQAATARHLRGAQERVLGAGIVAGPRLSVAETEQQIAELGIVGIVAALGQRQRQP